MRRATAVTTAATTTATAGMAHQTRIESTDRQPRSNSDPGVGAVPELLALPDRHLLLQGVDQGPARGERLGPVRGGRRDDHGKVADLQLPDAVHCSQGGAGVVGGDFARDLEELLAGGWVRGVFELGDLLA